MTTHRIEGLADGIFAIAMTLLVLNLALPEMGKGLAEVHSLLFGQIDKFLNYALSFVLLAAFWIRHHQQFYFIKRTDGKHLWINIFFFMFVGLIPFSTTLIGHYPRDSLAEVLFASNIFMLGMLLHWNWVYATNQHRLVDRSLDPQQIALEKKSGVVIILVAASAMGLAFADPRISFFVYLLIPILQGVVKYRHRRMTGVTA
ncbi:MAG: DUF1211 domain-containing protein [Chloroflexi bacterium]|nr:DUF1211 domain-containing protein [Chloroflexota bacterium]